MYNISSFYLTKVTSALTLVIAANVKIVGLIVVAAIFIDRYAAGPHFPLTPTSPILHAHVLR